MKCPITRVKNMHSSMENNPCTSERQYSDAPARHSVLGACVLRRGGANPDG